MIFSVFLFFFTSDGHLCRQLTENIFLFLQKDVFLNWTGLGKTHIFFITKTEKKLKKHDCFSSCFSSWERIFKRKRIASGPVPSGFNISVTGKHVFVKSPWTAAWSMRLYSKYFCISKEITPTGWCLKNKITSKMYALSPCSKGISLRPTLLYWSEIIQKVQVKH